MKDVRQLEHKHMKKIDSIIKDQWKSIPLERTIMLSTDHEDTNYSFDMRYSNDVKFSIRIRKNQYLKYSDITLRTRSRGGNYTEIDKLIDGHGQYYLYMWETQDSNSIEEWVLIDINVMRPYLHESYCTSQKKNGDGTEFATWDLLDLKNWECIIGSSSPILPINEQSA